MYITAFFTSSGVPITGLSPTIRIRDVSDNSLLVTDAAMSEIGDGNYKYNFITYDLHKDYAIRCDGGALLPDSERYTYGGNENYIEDIENSTLSDQISAVNTNVLSLSASIATSGSEAILNEIDDLSTQIDSLSASNQINFDTVNNNISEVNTNVLAVSASLVDVSDDIKRLLGLTHENVFIDNPSYDSDCNLTSARLRIYSNPASVGTTNDVIGTYQITAPSTAPGQFTSWKQVRTS